MYSIGICIIKARALSLYSSAHLANGAASRKRVELRELRVDLEVVAKRLPPQGHHVLETLLLHRLRDALRLLVRVQYMYNTNPTIGNI